MTRPEDTSLLFRRFVVIALSMSMASATIPAPASALSTPTEIQIGKEYDKQITDQSVIVTDPLLNQWVNEISNKLWAQTARKDVPYSIKIIDESDIKRVLDAGRLHLHQRGNAGLRPERRRAGRRDRPRDRVTSSAVMR